VEDHGGFNFSTGCIWDQRILAQNHLFLGYLNSMPGANYQAKNYRGKNDKVAVADCRVFERLRDRRKDPDLSRLCSLAAHCQKQAVKFGRKEAGSRSFNRCDPR
jgi:hypothetical protein